MAVDELIAAGMEIVRMLVAQAKALPAPHPFWGDKAPVEPPTEHIARSYERVSRSVRRSIVLARRLDRDAVERRGTAGGRSAPGPAGGRSAPGPADDATGADRERDDGEREDGGDVGAERCERMDRPDDDDDFSADESLPVADVIAEIRQELGREEPGLTAAPPRAAAGPSRATAAPSHRDGAQAAPTGGPPPPPPDRRSG